MRLVSSSGRLSHTARKDLGAFYTPAELTDFATSWAIQDAATTALDPGCGDAAFLVSAARRLEVLGAKRGALAQQVRGIDLNPDALETARAVLQEAGIEHPVLLLGNFFTAEPGEEALSPVDAVIGNPPYIRYQLFRDDNRAAGLKAAARAGVILPQLTSSWAPFVVHAASFLKPGGRMALVLPGELLHVGYAAAVRDFLLRQFAELTLISFEEKVFPGALEEVVLVLGIKGEGDGRLRVLRLNSLRDLQRGPEVLLDERRASSVKPGQRWLTTLLEEESVASALDIIQHADFMRLGEFGRVDIGVVTGANDFFVLSRAEAQFHGLTETVLLPAVSKASHIQGTRFTRRDWEFMGTNGDPVYLLVADPHSLTDKAVARYIATGEEKGLSKRYKCRTREPWYRVPYVRKPDLFLTYMSHVAPRLVVNELRATHTNTLHGVFLSDPLLAEPLAAAFLSSATLLSVEIEGRSYGGGVLKLEPGEAVRVLVPRLTPTLIEKLRTELPKVDQAVRDGRIEEASAMVDRIVLGKGFRREKREKVRSMLAALRSRRFTRGKTS